MELAPRGDRLAAMLADRALFLAALAPAVVTLLMGRHDGAGFLTSVALLPVLAGFQLYLLSVSGQTIGKRLLGIKIVRVKDLQNGGFTTNVLLRVFADALVGLLPAVGMFYRIADPFFVFRDDRRCLHDLVAGTCVIKAA